MADCCRAVLLALCWVGAAAANLIPNPSAELADSGQPAFWQQRTAGDQDRKLFWADTVARTGERSLGIRNLAETRSRWRVGHDGAIALRPGTTCQVSGWIRTEAVTRSAHFRVYFMAPGDGIQAQPQTRALSGDQDWTRVELTLTTPARPCYTMIYAELDGVGTAWYDDLELLGEPAEGYVGGELPAVSLGLDEHWGVAGYRPVTRSGRALLELPTEGRASGSVTFYFPGETARYQPVIEALDEPDGASELTLEVNGQPVGSVVLDQTPADGADRLVKRSLPPVDLQQHSRVVVKGVADRGEYARLAGLTFEPAGGFQGVLLSPEELPPPPSLRVLSTGPERASARAMLASWASRRFADPANAAREQRLAELRTPDDWRAYQQSIRARLTEYLGEDLETVDPEPRVTGHVERPGYVIERLAYRARPGTWVTANLYRPIGFTGRRPAALFVCGHAADGKAAVLYHECCLGLVLKGYVVLAIDPTGQGERKEYIDRETGHDNIGGPVAQHVQLGKPSFLVGRTLLGYRVWDARRGLDVLAARDDVDPSRIACVGNSGGGQMALMISAVDERIAVCAAAHPGGPMENTFLNGGRLRDIEVQALMAPRPCRVVVGRDSGEDHGYKVEEMRRVFRGLGLGDDRIELTWVDGVHNMERPKREACYEWLNRWLGVTDQDAIEPDLTAHEPPDLWVTQRGNVLLDLPEYLAGWQVNAARYRELRPTRTPPANPVEAEDPRTSFRTAVWRRLGGRPEAIAAPASQLVSVSQTPAGSVQRLLWDRGEGIRLQALWYQPPVVPPGAPVIVHVAEEGKPTRSDLPSLPGELAARGAPVLSVDVRGCGESDPAAGRLRPTANGWDPNLWRRDTLAIQIAGYGGRTLAAWRTDDLLAALAWVRQQPEAAGRPCWLVGEGLGGLWAMLAAGEAPEVERVIPVGTLLSYELAVDTERYELRGYWWVPGVASDFDLAELPVLAAPRPVHWLRPVDANLQPVDEAVWQQATGWTKRLAGEVSRGDCGPDPASLAAAIWAAVPAP